MEGVPSVKGPLDARKRILGTVHCILPNLAISKFGQRVNADEPRFSQYIKNACAPVPTTLTLVCETTSRQKDER